MMSFQIDLSQTFPNLARAPIVEAVIQWQSRAGRWFNPEELKQKLTARLPEYPACEAQHEMQVAATGVARGDTSVVHQTRWQGFRLRSQDPPHVVQFTETGIVFSRLEPYEDWEQFESAAFVCWRAFVAIAEPKDIQRLGVRFINRIALAAGETAASCLQQMPRPPKGVDLPCESFYHQELYPVPGGVYRVKLVRTVQPAASATANGAAVILDIDVFTTELLSLDEAVIRSRLAEMRWLKNKFFFSSITAKAQKRFLRPRP
jgi:uncharacterized protein (TIGR04255 family)